MITSIFGRVAAATAAAAFALAVAGSANAAGSHFKALGPNKAQGGDDALFFPNDFEAAVTGTPQPNALTFFSLCRRAPFDSTTLYSAFPPSNADAIVGDTTFTLVDGTTCYEPQNEQNIVINPTNSLNVVTSANDYRFGFQAFVYVSTDGGLTFTDVLLPGWSPFSGGQGVFKHAPAGGDPVLAFAPDGTLYYSALVYDFSFPNRTPSGVAVATSNDGGLHWGAPVLVHYENSNVFFNDKEWVTAGAGGNVYVTWTQFRMQPPTYAYASSNIVIAISHDHGATWSGPILVSDSAHPFDQADAVELREHHIDDGGVVVGRLGQRQAGLAIRRVIGRVAGLLEAAHDERRDFGIIFDHENPQAIQISCPNRHLAGDVAPNHLPLMFTERLSMNQGCEQILCYLRTSARATEADNQSTLVVDDLLVAGNLPVERCQLFFAELTQVVFRLHQ